MTDNGSPGASGVDEHFLHEAVALAGDDLRRMPGEEEDFAAAINTEHWIGIYQELLRFKGDLMQLVKSRRAALSVIASTAVAVDVTIIASQAARYLRRLDEWTALRDLATPTAEEAPIDGNVPPVVPSDEPPASSIPA